jgi:hypothetical protein
MLKKLRGMQENEDDKKRVNFLRIPQGHKRDFCSIAIAPKRVARCSAKGLRKLETRNAKLKASDLTEKRGSWNILKIRHY